ncbi:MAG: hypothetical protein ACKV2U_23285 [Bryobacteraceae bacterium]
MSNTTEKPTSPGTKAEKPPNGYWNASAEHLLTSLQVHLSDDNAHVLLERMKTIAEDSKNASDWTDVKARILRQKPQS